MSVENNDGNNINRLVNWRLAVSLFLFLAACVYFLSAISGIRAAFILGEANEFWKILSLGMCLFFLFVVFLCVDVSREVEDSFTFLIFAVLAVFGFFLSPQKIFALIHLFSAVAVCFLFQAHRVLVKRTEED